MQDFKTTIYGLEGLLSSIPSSTVIKEIDGA